MDVTKLTRAQQIEMVITKEYEWTKRTAFTPEEIAKAIKAHLGLEISPKRVSAEISRLAGIGERFRKAGKKGHSILWTSLSLEKEMSEEESRSVTTTQTEAEKIPEGDDNLDEIIRDLVVVPEKLNAIIDQLGTIQQIDTSNQTQIRNTANIVHGVPEWMAEVSNALIEIKLGVKYLAEQSTIVAQPNSDWRDGYKEGMRDGETRIREQILSFLETGFTPNKALMLVVGIEPKGLNS